MIRRDYILRMIEECIRALARISSLKQGQRWSEASAELDAEFNKLIGDGAQAVAQLSETELLARLMGAPYLVQVGLLAAVYLVAAKLALWLAIPAGYATAYGRPRHRPRRPCLETAPARNLIGAALANLTVNSSCPQRCLCERQYVGGAAGLRWRASSGCPTCSSAASRLSSLLHTRR
jgi:hypothetical protein